MKKKNAAARIRGLPGVVFLGVVVGGLACTSFGQAGASKKAANEPGVTRGVGGASFRGLGVPGDGGDGEMFSWPRAVSADGLVVVGEMGPWLEFEGRQAFRWTVGEGLVGLGDLENGNFKSIAFATNADGSAVVGRGSSSHDIGNARDEAFEWSADGGMVGIGGYIPTGISTVGLGPSFLAVGRGVVDDGSLIVGSALKIVGRRGDFVLGGLRPAVWGIDRRLTELGVIDSESEIGQANGVSADGGVIVGSETYVSGPGLRRAFVWTAATGMISIGDLDNISKDSAAAIAVSADGVVVVGHSKYQGRRVGFRWTSEDEMEGLARANGEIPSGEARGVSGDGSVIVGFEQTELGIAATVWTAEDGVRYLYVVLRELGIDLWSGENAWGLGEASAVSRDGRVIVGVGRNPEGQLEGFIAELWGVCEADLNDDGRLNGRDVRLFVQLVLAQDPAADLNDDGIVSVADLVEFVHTYREGCP